MRRFHAALLALSLAAAAPSCSSAKPELSRCCQQLVHVPRHAGTASYSFTLATRFELGLSWVTPSLKKLAKLRPERQLHLSFGERDEGET